VTLQLLHSNPELARTIKANDLGKYAGKLSTKTKAKALRSKPVVADPEANPWEAPNRLASRSTKRKADLAMLSDDE
jgi:hypothetical protein